MRAPPAVRFAAGLGALLLLWALHAPAPNSWLDRELYDRLVPRGSGPSPVVGVAITREDVAELGRFGVTPGTWPWKRIAHGAVVHALRTMGAEAVAFSLFFERPQDRASDQGLIREIRNAEIPVVLASYLVPGTREEDVGRDGSLPAPRLLGPRPPDHGALRPMLPELVEVAAGLGAVNLPAGGFTASRGVPLVYRSGERLVPSLALRGVLAARHLETLRWEPGPVLVAGDLRIPLTPGGRVLVGLEPVPRVSVRELLDAFAARPGRDPRIHGKLVFVGLEGTGLGAVHEVPGGPPLPSFQVQAGVARALLTGAWMRPITLLTGAGLLALLLLAAPSLPAALFLALVVVLLAPGTGFWISPAAFLTATLVGAGVPAAAAGVGAALARRAREAEMRRAEEIAQELLPAELPEGVRGLLQPARAAAGDYYDGIELPDGTRVVLVADVSGKGLDGALLAGQVRAAFRAFAAENPDPGRLLARMNSFLYRDLLRTGRLVTALCCAVDPEGALRSAAAAHPPCWIVAPGGRVREVTARGKPLGYREDSTYRVTGDRMEAGEWAVLVSDGVLEEPDRETGSPPGREVIRARLEGIQELGPAALTDVLLRADGPPRDDQTVLLVRLKEPAR